MDKQLIINKFFRFLKDNDIYHNYIFYATNSRYRLDDGIYLGKKYSLKNFLMNEKPSEYIGYAFSWDKTPQGDDFWDDVYMKWRSIYFSF